MAKLSTLSAAPTQRVIVFGAPKSGKTELIGELSKEFNLLWFDLENGSSTLLKRPKEDQERIELIRIPDTRIYPIAIETLLKVFTGLPTDVCETHGKVSCPLCRKESLPQIKVELNKLPTDTIVVVDSLTQLANSAMANITKTQSDDYKYDWDDYRKQGTLMDKFLSCCQQATYNLVCATHEAEVEMEDGRNKLVPVAGTTNFSRNTAKYFDHVIYCEQKNRKHTFASSTTYANNILTGSRTDYEIEGSDSPSLLPIFRGEIITKDKNADSVNKLASLKLKLGK